MYGGITVRRIEHIPVTGGELGHECKTSIAENTHSRHLTNVVEAKEAVAFGVVGSFFDDGSDDPFHIRWVHLTIAIHLHHDFHPGIQSGFVARDCGTADALVFVMPHDLYPGVVNLPFNHIADPFRTGIVHAENVIHKCRHFSKDIYDPAFSPIARDNYRDRRTSHVFCGMITNYCHSLHLFIDADHPLRTEIYYPSPLILLSCA